MCALRSVAVRQNARFVPVMTVSAMLYRSFSEAHSMSFADAPHLNPTSSIMYISRRSKSSRKKAKVGKMRARCDVHKKMRVRKELEKTEADELKCTADSPCDESHPLFVEKLKCAKHGNLRYPDALKEVEGEMVCKGERICRSKVKEGEKSTQSVEKESTRKTKKKVTKQSAIEKPKESKATEKLKSKRKSATKGSDENQAAESVTEPAEVKISEKDTNSNSTEKKRKLRLRLRRKLANASHRRVCDTHLKWRNRDKLVKNQDTKKWKCTENSDCSKIALLEDAIAATESSCVTVHGLPLQVRRCRFHDQLRAINNLEKAEDGSYGCKDHSCMQSKAREVCSIHKILRVKNTLKLVENRRRIYTCTENSNCYKIMQLKK